MAKYMSRNDIKRNYKNIILVPYNRIGNLSDMLGRVGYNSGYCGWNYDIFGLTSDTCMLTGYRVPKSICTARLSVDAADKLFDDFLQDAKICTAWRQLADKMPDYAERIIAASV